MVVADIMTENPVTIAPESSLYGAMETMTRIHCHHLPVVSEQGHLVGVISTNDCQRALHWLQVNGSGRQEEPLTQYLSVGTVMTPAPVIVEPNTPAHEAARLMLTNHIGCLPVMRGETLIGIITTSDLLIAFMQLTKNEPDSPASNSPSANGH